MGEGYPGEMGKRLLLFLLLPLMAACFKKNEPAHGKPTVLVTIAPYAQFVERIAKDTVVIETLVPPGVNLHIYEPTPKHVEKTAAAGVWFQIAEPFEKKITTAFKEQNPQMEIVNLQQGLDLIEEEETKELAPCLGHSHEGKDLHTWLSPKLALIQARHIANTLATLFPEQKDFYEKNFNRLAIDLRLLDEQIGTKLKPFEGQAILVSHPALGYFCRDYSLIQLSVECEGKDPRPKDVEEILKKTKSYNVRCVLLQKGFNNRGAQLIGQKLQLPIDEIDPYAENYIHNMREIAGYIAQ